MSWRLFDRLAMRYDGWYEGNRSIYEDELAAVRALELRGRGSEFGVGTGRFAIPLGVQFGLDPSEGVLRIAVRRGLEVARGFAEVAPLRDSSLDYVLLVVTLCFVDDPLTVLREASRTVRRGGSVAVCIIPRDSRWGLYYSSKDSPFYSQARFYSIGDLEEMFSRAGLEVEGYLSTLFFDPSEEPRKEEPKPGPNGGFVCVKASRRA